MMSPSYPQLAAVAIGGALGAVLRFSIAYLLPNQSLLATASVNAGGSLLLGIFLATPALGVEFRPLLRLLFTVGFCGGFTTFSTFSAQTLELLQQSRTAVAFLNITGNNVASIACVWFGYSLTRLCFP